VDVSFLQDGGVNPRNPLGLLAGAFVTALTPWSLSTATAPARSLIDAAPKLVPIQGR
jgi:hypothetical protein